MHRKVSAKFVFIICFIVAALFSNVIQAADYLLGPDDVVKITTYNQPDLSVEAQITKNGTITFPLLGEVRIGGLEKSAAEALIAEQLRAGNYIKQPQVNLLVTQYRSRRVSVLGHVNKPGIYTIDRVSYVTDLVSQASGVAADGADVATLIKKSGDGKVQKQNIDLIKLFNARDNSENYEVADGDIIYVGRAPIFYIYGEVQKPGGYRLERGMNVMQALSIGGGLTPRGTERGLRINRTADDGNLRVLDVDTNTELKENDVIHVKQRLF